MRLFSERTGLPVTAIENELTMAQAKGWLERDLTTVKPSARGYDFLNDLQSLFLPVQA